MFRQVQLAVHGLAILLGRIEGGISNKGTNFLLLLVISSVDGCFCFNKQIDCSASEFPDLNILLTAHTPLQQVQNVGWTLIDIRSIRVGSQLKVSSSAKKSY